MHCLTAQILLNSAVSLVPRRWVGCSTNSMLHLPAIAHECGVELNLDIANEISAVTPNLCHLAPAGPTYMEDLNEAGGVYAVLKELENLGLLDTSVMTCTGKTMGENIALGRKNADIDEIRAAFETAGLRELEEKLEKLFEEWEELHA